MRCMDLLQKESTNYAQKRLTWSFIKQPKWLFLSINPTHYIIASSAGNMNQIFRSDWLAERARWQCLVRSGLRAMFRKKYPWRSYFWCTLSHIINPLLTELVRSRWLDNGFARFCFGCLWTSTPSRSTNTQNNNNNNNNNNNIFIFSIYM